MGCLLLLAAFENMNMALCNS
uniref:Uncharacterized protein n=1 Tax=Arundo donax TaxID=35708 RepID=A0A0A9BE44_ARUDO